MKFYQHSLIAVSLLIACAVSYQLNDIEQTALECVRQSYAMGPGLKTGKIQVTCDRSDIDTVNVWVESYALAGAFNKLHLDKAGGKCVAKESEPMFLKSAFLCARKLLAFHCNTVIAATEKDKNNIDELVKTITPPMQACELIYEMTKLEKLALDCINSAVTTANLNGGEIMDLKIVCNRDKFQELKASFVRTQLREETVPLRGLKHACKSKKAKTSEDGKRAAACAELLLEQMCNGEFPVKSLIVKATPTTKRICEGDI